MTKSEKFAKLNGIEWHIYHPIKNHTMRILPYWICSCGKSSCNAKNPTFSDAKSILEVMDKRKDGKEFYAHLRYIEFSIEPTENDDDGCIDRDYILNPDKLLDEAIEWCERKE